MVKISKKAREKISHWLFIPLLYLLFRSQSDLESWNPAWVAWEPLFSMGYIFLLWEGNYYICSFWDRRFPGFHTTVKRLVRQMLTCTVYILLVNAFLAQLFDILEVVDQTRSDTFKDHLLSGLLVSYLIIAVFEGAEFYKGWKTHLIKVETLALEKSEIQLALVDAQLSALRDQLNPHFLFNSLNTLSSLIDLKNKKAITYLEQLADVYRYLLENREKNLVSLDEELDFASTYIALNKTRFRNDLTYTVTVDDQADRVLLPPYALQLTLENAIKHNAIGPDKPLEITVTNDHGYLVVANNIRLKPVLATSMGMGLENLRHRSQLATGKPIEIIKTADHFTVKIPLAYQEDLSSTIPGTTALNTSKHAHSNY